MRAKAENLLFALKAGTKKLDSSKFTQVGMDGPSVNHKVLRLLNSERMSSCLPQLIDIGTCSLHIVCGALKSADKSNDFWGVGSFLMSVHYVFHDSPMRKSLLIDLSEDERPGVPLKFSATRWVENSRVASCVIDLLPNLKAFQQQCASTKTEPKSKSYLAMRSNLQDKFLVLKLTVFNSVAIYLEKFLVKYQTDAPMIPFLYADLYELIQCLMKRIVKDELII